MAHEQFLRLFLAIDLPATVRGALGRVQSRVKPIYGVGTCPKPEYLHITLHFLGDTPVSRLPALIEAFNATAMPILTLRPGELSYLPDARRARVAMVGVDGDVDLLTDLHARLGAQLKELGFRLDHRKYTPHITIARFKAPPRHGADEATTAARSVLNGVEAFRAMQFTLYESTLDPKGAKYAPLGRFPRTRM